MYAAPADAFLLTDPLGRKSIKIERESALAYYAEHRCTGIDELVRRRALANDIAADPPSAMALWAWTPGDKA